jgi:hypothetical protein
MLSDKDLMENKNKYSIAELTASVANLDTLLLVTTQILDEHFCAEYILDVRIDSGDEDSYKFTEAYILNRQPHLDRKLFLELCKIQYANYFDSF